MRLPSFRQTVTLLFLALVTSAPPADAEEKPTGTAPPKARAAEPAAIRPVRVPVSGAVTALAADHGKRGLVVGTADGVVRGWEIGDGQTFELSLGAGAIIDLAIDPAGRFLAAANADELFIVDRSVKKPEILWRAERQVAFEFNQQGTSLLSVSAKGLFTTRRSADGHVLSTKQAASKRLVERAALQPGGELAVLGVADG